MLALYLQMLDSPEDQSEFEKLYHTHRDLMYFIAYNVLHDHQRAEDAVSETFLRLAQCFSRVLEIGPVDSLPVKRYVAVSVKNLSLNMIARTKNHPETEFDDYKLPLITEESMNALLEQETLDRTLATLNELPEKYLKNIGRHCSCMPYTGMIFPKYQSSFGFPTVLYTSEFNVLVKCL